jgi:LysW-gamma-L-alpha-aminoadipyl-6-phosphate/LysW-L-glutamyl-5-phosphate reductase
VTKSFKAAVIGGTGYGGGELIRRLLMHPHVELARVASIDCVGQPLGAAHPNLEGLSDLRFEDLSPAEAAAGCDVALFALPHRVSAVLIAPLVDRGVKIVDLSGDFRLRDSAAYEHYYGAAHPRPDLLSRFVYGLPELNRPRIREAQHVASPGCFATCIALALLPVARSGWLRGPVHVTAITGSSGSGMAPSPGTHHPVRAGNLKTYRPLAHQHTPEIEQTLHQAGAKAVALRFVPVSAPLVRGIFTTAYVEIPADIDDAAVAAAFDRTYRDERFVRRPHARLPEVAAVAGSLHAEVGFALGPAPDGTGTRTLTCFSAIDNLVKGGAGQGIQNMNLLLGIDEGASLSDPGSWP